MYHMRVCALTHSYAKDIGRVRLDGHKIHCHDGHSVIINHESEVSINGSIDKSQSVGAILCDRNRESGTSLVVIVVIAIYIGSVDKAIVQGRGSTSFCTDVKLIDGLMAPIVEKQMAEILVIV